MRRLQRVEHAQHQRQRLVRRQAAARLQVLGERAAGHVFEDEVGAAVLHVGLEHRHDVRVREPADAARLLQPVRDVLRVDLGAGGDHLHRHLALQPRIEAEPDRRLRALAEDAAQFEAAEPLGLVGHHGKAHRGRSFMRRCRRLVRVRRR
jgi:hypothetical protein